MKQIYTDIKGKNFKLNLWCKRFKRNCDDITKDNVKEKCHGICKACVEHEEA